MIQHAVCFSYFFKAVGAVHALLDKLDKWIEEIPPHPTPQRFGNLAFRTWGKKLEEVRQLLHVR